MPAPPGMGVRQTGRFVMEPSRPSIASPQLTRVMLKRLRLAVAWMAFLAAAAVVAAALLPLMLTL